MTLVAGVLGWAAVVLVWAVLVAFARGGER